MDIIEATCGYEAWLASVISTPLVQLDLDHKHALMADPANPFPFFHGTYYRWAQRWLDAAGPLAVAPQVLAVGDLHVENFGTWSDADGRLCWGVNDFDEADDLPYTNDLVRLVASVLFASKAGTLNIQFDQACQAILDGYRGCLNLGGQPFVLEEHHSHLRSLATSVERDPVTYWEKMTTLLSDAPEEVPTEAQAVLAGVLPAVGLAVEYRARPRAGVGSLGRPRFVALAEWAGGGDRHREGKRDRHRKGKHRSTSSACGLEAAAGGEGCSRWTNSPGSGNYAGTV